MTGPEDSLVAQPRGIRTLSIPDIYCEGVATWVGILAGHIALINAVPIPETVEPAPVFCA